MYIQYHGHSCIQITTEEHSFIFDPFISPKSAAQSKPEDIKVQHVLLSHAHGDHIADAVAIAKANEAMVISIVELATYVGWQGVKTHGMNLGGSYSFDFGKVKLTQAFHSSGVVDEERQIIHYMGMPAGFIVEAGGKTIYFAGDTNLFYDMKLIGERHRIDVAFLPIGDNFTMGPEDALQAAAWIDAKLTIPIHYNTFPIIEQDPHKFVAGLQEYGLEGKVLGIGDKFEL